MSSFLDVYVETISFRFDSESVTDTKRRSVATSCALSGIK